MVQLSSLQFNIESLHTAHCALHTTHAKSPYTRAKEPIQKVLLPQRIPPRGPCLCLTHLLEVALDAVVGSARPVVRKWAQWRSCLMESTAAQASRDTPLLRPRGRYSLPPKTSPSNLAGIAALESHSAMVASCERRWAVK